MTLHAGYPTPIRMSDDRYWARWMEGVYWHQVCSYGQPVGSKELLETTGASDIRLNNELFLRSVVRIKAACKTCAEAMRLQTLQRQHTSPLDFRVMVPPWEQNKETTEYNHQSCQQHRPVPNPGTQHSPQINTLTKARNWVLFSKMRLPLRDDFHNQEN